MGPPKPPYKVEDYMEIQGTWYHWRAFSHGVNYFLGAVQRC